MLIELRYYRLLGPHAAVVVAVWCLTAIVIVNAYTNSMAQMLLIVNNQRIFEPHYLY